MAATASSAVFARRIALPSASSGAQTQFVTDAVHNAALTCYAVEGAYPNDLEYLRTHYGLAYDQSRYLVTYSTFASNLMPEITVIQHHDEK